MKKILLILAVLLLIYGSVNAAQKAVTVGTAGTPADIDVNFGNTQDNFTELYGWEGTIATNTAKISITTGQASAIVINTAKTGITSGQANAITANTAKVTNAAHTGDVTGSGALTIANGVVGADELASTAVTPGSYTTADITVDADGRITLATNGTSGSGSALVVQEEGSELDATVDTINFIGSGITAVEGIDHTINVTVSAGAAPIDTVNGQTGTVILNADDIADTSTTSKFATVAELAAIATNSAKISFDSTSSTKLGGVSTGATVNSSDATLLGRENHTGSQPASTISDFTAEVANNSAVAVNTAKVGVTVEETNEVMDQTPTVGNTDHTVSSDGIYNALLLKAPTENPTLSGTVTIPALTGITYAGTSLVLAIQAVLDAIDNAVDLGASTFSLTLFDDTTEGAWLTTLGLSANGQSLTAAANYAAMRTLLDLEAGMDFLPPSAIDTLVKAKYISGTENDYMGSLLNIQGIYDVDSTNHAVTIDNITPAAFTITEISVSCDADPTTEQTITFYHKAAGVGYGTPTTIEAVTTTAGTATITSGLDDATIPAGVKLFMVLSDPDDALLECAWKIEGDFD